MSTYRNTRLIGPLTKSIGNYTWRTSAGDDLICDKPLRKRFNFPFDMKELWITLYRNDPKDETAIRVVFGDRHLRDLDGHRCKLYMHPLACTIIHNFLSPNPSSTPFYATFDYK